MNSKINKALHTKGNGAAKRIFKSAKKAFANGDDKNGKALWKIGKKRIAFVSKNHR